LNYDAEKRERLFEKIMSEQQAGGAMTTNPDLVA